MTGVHGVKPPRGAVVITRAYAQGLLGTVETHTATCRSCGWTYANTVRSDVETHKRWHLCPVVKP